MVEVWPIYLQITSVYPYALAMAHQTIQVQQYLVVLVAVSGSFIFRHHFTLITILLFH